MKTEEMVELPEKFYPESNNPDKILKNLFREITEFRVKCSECKEKIFASTIIVNNIEPWIEHTEKNNFTHPLYQIANWEELFYCVCPKCGEPATMEGKDVK